MHVTSEKSLTIEAAPTAVWTVLKDMEQVVPCVPGAKITEQTGENAYKGTVSVKVGPVTSKYKGDFSIIELDEETMSLTIDGKGLDAKGKGSANMIMKARLEGADGGTAVICTMEASVTGKLAQLGSRMFEEVNNQIFQKFTANFIARVPSGEAPAEAASETSAVESTTDETASAATAATEPSPAPAKDAEPEAVNGLAIFFKALWNVIKGWFKRKKAA